MVRALYKAFSPKIQNNLFYLYLDTAKANGLKSADKLKPLLAEQKLEKSEKVNIIKESLPKNSLNLQEKDQMDTWDKQLKSLIKEIPQSKIKNDLRHFRSFSRKIFNSLFPHLQATVREIWIKQL
jgi:predicted lipase